MNIVDQGYWIVPNSLSALELVDVIVAMAEKTVYNNMFTKPKIFKTNGIWSCENTITIDEGMTEYVTSYDSSPENAYRKWLMLIKSRQENISVV